MTIRDALEGAGAKPAGKRPWFFRDPDVERVLTITMAVATELAVLRQRLDTVERVLDERGVLTRADIEAFEPDKQAAEERGAWTQEYLARVLRVMRQEREAIARGKEVASEDVGKELEGE
jgi:hypothetical protein